VNGLAPRAREDSVRPRRLADVVVRPLNFTVRGTVREGEVWVWPRRFCFTPKRTLRYRGAITDAEFVGLRRCVSGSILPRRLRWAGPFARRRGRVQSRG